MQWLFDFWDAITRLINVPVSYIVGHRTSGRLVRPGIIDAKGVAEAIANSISNENKHIELRFQWNLGLQGFLFASYAIAIGESTSSSNNHVIKGFADTISTVGILSCAITIFGLYAAYRAINRQKMKWLSNSIALEKVSSEPFSDVWPSLIGRIPSIAITFVILWSWTRLESLI